MTTSVFHEGHITSTASFHDNHMSNQEGEDHILRISCLGQTVICSTDTLAFG